MSTTAQVVCILGGAGVVGLAVWWLVARYRAHKNAANIEQALKLVAEERRKRANLEAQRDVDRIVTEETRRSDDVSLADYLSKSRKGK